LCGIAREIPLDEIIKQENEVPVQGIFYVSIQVSDLERSKKFYGQTLGWKLGTDEAAVAGFHFGSAYLVALHDQRIQAERRYAGGMHVEVKVDDIDAEYARLQEAGVEVGELRTQAWGERNFAFEDPDGYRWSYGQGH
jgi:catechol 2,3-dioxygenase-like lactoylglutathione lyase family enzyme